MINGEIMGTVAIVLIVIGIIFVSLGAFHSNLWFDESYSVGLARHTFREIWSIGAVSYTHLTLPTT